MFTRRKYAEAGAPRDSLVKNCLIVACGIMFTAFLFTNTIGVEADTARETPQEKAGAEMVLDGSVQLRTVEDAEQYYRSFLDPRQQAVYDAIKTGVCEFSTTIRLPEACGYDELEDIVGWLLLDNPDIAWFDGEADFVGDGNSFTKVKPIYRADRAEGERVLYQVRDAESSLATSDDPEEQMRLIMEHVAKNTVHDGSGKNEQTVMGAISKGKAVCAGYAKETAILARLKGIPVVCIKGDALGERHMWLAARIGDKILYYDPYWFDRGKTVDNDYCGATIEQIADTHREDEPEKLPRT